MYNELAEYYDLIDAKSEEDIKRDARQMTRLIKQFKTTESDALLDVGCGTGRHLRYLENVFSCFGVDANRGVLDIAQKSTSDTEFKEADMKTLQLEDEFGVIICLFNTIAYARTEEGVRQTIERFYEHLEEGGVAIIEPYNSPSEYKLSEREPTMMTYDGDDVKIARHQIIKTEGRNSILRIHYLISERDADDVMYVTDTHKLWLFEPEEIIDMMSKVGFKNVEFHEDNLSDGAIVGIR